MNNELILGVGVPLMSGVIAFAVGWGYMKGEARIFITHPQHRDVCEKVKEGESLKRAEIYETMREGLGQQNLKMDELIRAVGRIEGVIQRNNGV